MAIFETDSREVCVFVSAWFPVCNVMSLFILILWFFMHTSFSACILSRSRSDFVASRIICIFIYIVNFMTDTLITLLLLIGDDKWSNEKYLFRCNQYESMLCIWVYVDVYGLLARDFHVNWIPSEFRFSLKLHRTRHKLLATILLKRRGKKTTTTL